MLAFRRDPLSYGGLDGVFPPTLHAELGAAVAHGLLRSKGRQATLLPLACVIGRLEATVAVDAAAADIANINGELEAAVAVVTHDLDFALMTCPRAVIVADGGIIADGPTAELLADAALLARAGLAAPPVMQALSWLERHTQC